MKYFLNKVFASVLFVTNTAHAQSDLGKGLQFGAGAFSSIYIHELGHAAVAKANGASDVKIEVPNPKSGIFSGVMTPTYDAPITREQKKWEFASGLIAQNLAAELVIRNKALGQNAFGQGVAGTAMLSNVMHVYGYYFKYIGRDGWQGNDIDGYYQMGGNPHVFSALLLTYTAYSLSRMRQKEIPLFGVSLKF